MDGEREIGDLLAEIIGELRTGRHEGICVTFSYWQTRLRDHQPI